jgi:hypothetical protein
MENNNNNNKWMNKHINLKSQENNHLEDIK